MARRTSRRGKALSTTQDLYYDHNRRKARACLSLSERGDVQVTSDAADPNDDVPLAKLTAEGDIAGAETVAVNISPRRGSRIAGKKQASEALQKLASLREQRHNRTYTQPASSKAPDKSHPVTASSLVTDSLGNHSAAVSTDQASDADWFPGKTSDVSTVIESSDDSSEHDQLPKKAFSGKGQKSRGQQATSTSKASLVARQQSKQQSYRSPLAAQTSRFVDGGGRRSISGSDEEGEEDFIASEDDEQILSQSRKRLHDSSARQNRSVKDKLNWSDSSSQGSQIKKSIRQEPALPKEVAQPAGEEENVHRDTAIAGPSAQADDEESPQPSKRQRQVSNIIGDEDEWDSAAMQAQVSCKDQQHSQVKRQDKLEDEAHDVQQPVPCRKRRLSKAASLDDHDEDTIPSVKKRKAVDAISDDSSDDDQATKSPQRSRLQRLSGSGNSVVSDQQPGHSNAADLLAAEGIEPVEEVPEGSCPTRLRCQSVNAGAASIKDRLKQNQQKVLAGSKKRRHPKPPGLAKDRMKVWQNDHWVDASDSTAQASSSVSDEEEGSQQAEDDSSDSEHDSDMKDFLADDDDEEALAPAGSSDAENEHAEKVSSANAVSAMLEGAGMVAPNTDKEYFSIYIQYLALDLVDNTFAVRVRGEAEYRRYFETAVRHVEESLAFKRDSCCTSSAWMNAVPGFLDKVDTYPGLSSDIAAHNSCFDEDHGGLCMACQRSFTAGHASRQLTLKGRPYKQLWQYGFRRVSDAHVRPDLPYQDNGSSDEESDFGRHQELQFAVGRFCCARLQMYHALVHYKHRLRGKLKKLIKHEYNMQKIRRQAGDWVKAAKQVPERRDIVAGLFRQYAALKDLATDYATKIERSTWRKDQGSLGQEVDRLMYQLNSDSEGDEGSDIVPEDGVESQSGHNSDAANDDDAGTREVEHTAAGAQEHDAEPAGSSHDIPRGPAQALPDTDSAAKALQHSLHSQQQQSTAADVSSAVLTLPYEAGLGSAPPSAPEQTLSYQAASNSQLYQAGHPQQTGPIDLTEAEYAPELPEPAGSHAAATLAQVSGQQVHRAEPAASPLQRSSLVSPTSPATGSAQKQRQADIRGFLSPRKLQG